MQRHKYVMGKWNLLHLCSIVLLFVVAATNSEECEQKSSCECEYDDGTSINIQNLFKSIDGTDYFQAQNSDYVIYYHGCVDVKFQIHFENITENKCRSAAVICIYNENTKKIDTLANSSSGSFKFEHNIQTLSYRYDGMNTIVELVCTPDFADDVFIIRNISRDGKEFRLALLSNKTCRSSLHRGLSTGSKLLIMFFTFSLVYLIGGACLAYFIRGARGRELIPNVDMWMSLPGLVKDGFIFLISGCNTRLITTAETYDQI